MPLYYWLTDTRTVVAVAVHAESAEDARRKVIEADQSAAAAGTYLMPGNVLNDISNEPGVVQDHEVWVILEDR